MIRNFFIVATRNFLRQRLYSFINVFGLASGLTCALFIYLWVNDEVSKDKFHHQSEKIFLVISTLELNKEEIMTWTITPGPLAEHIRENIPEVEMAVRTMGTGQLLVQHGEKSFMETGFYADPDFFNLFSFTILRGKPNRDSTDISTISISEKLSKKLFGDADAVGKTVKINNQTDYTIGAIFQDIGTESSIQFDYILPLEVYKKNRGQGFNWGNYDHPLYVRLSDPTAAESVREKIDASVLAAVGPKDAANFYLQPFTEYYLHSNYENGRPVGGRIEYVRIFSVVAVFILIIACINFMNMATARAANRSKEVGVRKVVGAQRKSLIVQFIGESTLVSFLSMMFALAIVFLLLPLFNEVVNKQIVFDLFKGGFLVTVIFIIGITGLLAGSYPAFFLSSYQPVQVLKGSAVQNLSGTALRKGLVVFQFALTVILIACSLVVYNQIEYIRNKNIGYNRESILTFSLRGNLWKEFDAFKNEALQFSGITHVARADNSLVQVNNQNGSVDWPGKPDNSTVFFRTVVVDYDFPETMDLKLKEGRFFKKEFNDTSTFVLSERAVEVMGLQDPVGTRMVQWGIPGKVIGVVADFHSQSMHQPIDPIVLMLKPEWTGKGFVRFEGDQSQAAIRHLEGLYKKYNPQYPFTYAFLDDDFERLYNTEKVTGSLALGFTVMAIIISGLGLLGLAAYTAERRRKEISIRKTLGASVGSIVSMMSTDFVKLSFAAAIIGCPVAYYLMEKFLEGYAYHAILRWDLFLITAFGALVISLLTVIVQVTKAAIANPVDALRNE
jgi:ABC-type antimicrobial peptide transport system permease subunit